MAVQQTSRPRNRKVMIISVATDLFREHGYAKVSLEQIASAIGISGPALYRHFRNKQRLLTEVLDVTVTAIEDAVSASVEGRELLDLLAGFAVEQTAFGVLWQRELPKTAATDRALLAGRIERVVRKIAVSIDAARGGSGVPTDISYALARAVVAAAGSTTFYRSGARPERQRELLSAVFTAIATAEGVTPVAGRPARVEPILKAQPWLTRRQALLIVAPRLTQAKGGYDGVTMEDLGTAAGMSGASVYNYFGSKAEVFEAAIEQAVIWNRAALEQAWVTSTSPEDLLGRALQSCARLADEFPELVRCVLNDIVELPEPQKSAVLAHATDYTAEWQRCLQVARPDLPPDDAEVVTYAMLAVIGDLARPDLRGNRVFRAGDLAALAARVAYAGSGPGRATGASAGRPGAPT